MTEQKGQKPDYSLISKNEETGKWDNYGALWERDGKPGMSGNIVAARDIRKGEKIKVLLTKNDKDFKGAGVSGKPPINSGGSKPANIDSELESLEAHYRSGPTGPRAGGRTEEPEDDLGI